MTTWLTEVIVPAKTVHALSQWICRWELQGISKYGTFITKLNGLQLYHICFSSVCTLYAFRAYACEHMRAWMHVTFLLTGVLLNEYWRKMTVHHVHYIVSNLKVLKLKKKPQNYCILWQDGVFGLFKAKNFVLQTQIKATVKIFTF
jgi:hypothetical protein